ncbi:hypothetical protein FCM35_KLT19643 [Carex littledalei]|uniref:Uncharacterized protein n=1 Tax=Carex littledalei TaxID=544730 RepID=A0A833RFJ9_9POAL|nr:hypothetical protein FCM35_KLT19643 [Carex littledalei]
MAENLFAAQASLLLFMLLMVASLQVDASIISFEESEPIHRKLNKTKSETDEEHVPFQM